MRELSSRGPPPPSYNAMAFTVMLIITGNASSGRWKSAREANASLDIAGGLVDPLRFDNYFARCYFLSFYLANVFFIHLIDLELKLGWGEQKKICSQLYVLAVVSSERWARLTKCYYQLGVVDSKEK